MVENINVSVEDEVCRNEEYLSKLDRNVKTKCSIQLVAENLSKIEVFWDAVAKYFAEEKDIIESYETIKKMKCVKELKGHRGCVNRLTFNRRVSSQLMN